MSFVKPLTSLREQNRSLNHFERVQGYPAVESLPLVSKIEVTTQCNLRCTMCSVTYREAKGDFLDFSTFMKLEPIFPYLISTYLYGVGEPLLHPQVMDMFDVLAASGVNVGFITNGTLIQEKKVRRWLSGGLYKLSISMDGATADVYENIRRKGSWVRLLQNLDCLASLKREAESRFPILTLNFIAMRQNIQDLIPLVALAHHYQAEEVIVSELIPFTEEMKGQVLRYEDPVLQKNYEQAEKLAQELQIRLALPNPYVRWREQKRNDLRLSQKEERLSLCGDVSLQKDLSVATVMEEQIGDIPFAFCTEPWSGFWLSQKGEVTPCCYWFKGMGNLETSPFREIWNNRRYQDLRQTVNSPQKRHAQCRKCPVPV